MADQDDGLLAMCFSDEEDTVTVKPARRTEQTEEEFQAVRTTYSVKVENGNVWIAETIQLPVEEGFDKMHAQQVIHAVEELYYFRRFGEAVGFLEQVLQEGNRQGFDSDGWDLLSVYKQKCLKRMAA